MNDFKGSKYERGRDVVSIAALVRADIKDAIEAGKLPRGTKTSVRISRFSGGVSLSVYIKHLGGKRAINPAWVLWHDDNPHGYFGDGPPRYTATATRAKDVIEGLVMAYKRDQSDSQVDYFNVNFYHNVEFDYDMREADEALTRRLEHYPDLSAKALADEPGPEPLVLAAEAAEPTPKPTTIKGFPIFNQKETFTC